MKKDMIVGIAVMLVVLAGVVYYAATRLETATAPALAIPLTGNSYTERAAYYDIAANYASSTPLLAQVGTKADEAAVARMKQFVSDTIVQFKTDGNFANLTPNDVKVMGYDQGRKQVLQINYLIASSPRTITYIFTVYADTLGAHGNTTFKTFTFDTDPSTSSGQAGVPLALADVFVRNTNYLETLSTIARAKLPEIIDSSADSSFIDEGTTPEEKNFENFFFDNTYLVILFAPYQVAPYSAGPQTLRIPLTDLVSILKSEYR